ncbi:MAG: pilus assembly protein N-terminal domain-containing protein [Candidatus Omnitrophica bacterium]|nr:pilus assembly protein N-terminal domain-containing protein [Candidatus Omnitrophota bacterium]
MRKGALKVFILCMLTIFISLQSNIQLYAQLSEVGDTINFTSSEISVQAIRMVDNTSRLLTFERPVVRTAIGDAAVADVVAVSQKEILVVANTVGNTNLVIWEAGGISETFQVFVERDPHVLEDLIESRFPGIDIKVHSVGETFALTGEIDNAQERTEVMELAERYAAGAVDMMTLRLPKQVLIDVFFVELDRTDSDDYGYSWQSISKYINLSSFAGNVAGQTFVDNDLSAAKGAFTTDSLAIDRSATFPTISYIDGKTNLLSTLEFLESKNFLRVIAKPKLLAKDGEEAEFLVGGRFPFATVQDGSTNVQFEEFGHELRFKPEILEDDIIRLTVETIVSELNFASTLTISGSTVPSIIENNAKTVVELRDKQTLVIGGFISKRTNDTRTSVPFLAQIPGIGKMFRSGDLETREHELIFIITPHVILPMELEEAQKAGDFYDPEKIDRVIRIEDLPDENYQADALRGALRNYEVNRMLAEQNSTESMETVKPADLASEASHAVDLSGKSGQESGTGMKEETGGGFEEPMLNKGKFELDQALKNLPSDDGTMNADRVPLPFDQAPVVRGAAFDHPETSQSVLAAFQTFMKNRMIRDNNRYVLTTESKEDLEDVELDFEQPVVTPAAYVQEIPQAPKQVVQLSEAAPIEHYKDVIPAKAGIQSLDARFRGVDLNTEALPEALNALSESAMEIHYKDIRSYPSAAYQEAISASQQTMAAGIPGDRHYQTVGPAIRDSVTDGSVMSSENISRYNSGTRNFRMSPGHWSSIEQNNFRREQERIDQFFDSLDARKNI